MKRLIAIQQKLKAPKGQYNSFGKYNYRNCEDILEAVKPLLSESGLALILNDDVISIDGRFYIKAVANLYDEDGKIIATTSAIAREEETKKGMDGSQVTGASSSYARKYALNGLFAIDDTKDSDSTNNGKEPTNKKPSAKTEPVEKEQETQTDELAELDIYEGLKTMADTKRAFAYFQEQLPNVSDKTKFRKEYQQIYNKLKAKENK